MRLAAYLRSVQVKQRGFDKWLYARGYSVHDAKERVLKFRNESDALDSSMPSASSILPVRLVSEPDVPIRPCDLLTGISLTLPDGTVINIRRGSAEAVVSFLKLYSEEGVPCSD